MGFSVLVRHKGLDRLPRVRLQAASSAPLTVAFGPLAIRRFTEPYHLTLVPLTFALNRHNYRKYVLYFTG